MEGLQIWVYSHKSEIPIIELCQSVGFSSDEHLHAPQPTWQVRRRLDPWAVFSVVFLAVVAKGAHGAREHAFVHRADHFRRLSAARVRYHELVTDQVR